MGGLRRELHEDDEGEEGKLTASTSLPLAYILTSQMYPTCRFHPELRGTAIHPDLASIGLLHLDAHHRRTKLEDVDVRVSSFIQSAGSKLLLWRLDSCEGVQIEMLSTWHIWMDVFGLIDECYADRVGTRQSRRLGFYSYPTTVMVVLSTKPIIFLGFITIISNLNFHIYYGSACHGERELSCTLNFIISHLWQPKCT